MHAEHACAARGAVFRMLAETGDHAHQLVARGGHRGGEQACRAMLRVQARDGLRGVAAFHDVRAAAAVHVQIDEAGQDIRRVVRRRIDALAFERRHAPVLEANRAVDPAVGREYVSFQHEVLCCYAMRSEAENRPLHAASRFNVRPASRVLSFF